jgi:hypothetical protein
VPLSNYIVARVRHVIRRGLHSGPEDAVPIRLTLAQYRRDADGGVVIGGLKIEGTESATIAALRELVSSDRAADESRWDEKALPPRVPVGGTGCDDQGS